jgi:hypothetical protein
VIAGKRESSEIHDPFFAFAFLKKIGESLWQTGV